MTVRTCTVCNTTTAVRYCLSSSVALTNATESSLFAALHMHRFEKVHPSAPVLQQFTLLHPPLPAPSVVKLLIYVFCIYLRTNSDLCHLQHKLIGFCYRDEKCLQRGTEWGFKYSGLRLVLRGLMRYKLHKYVYICYGISRHCYVF
jgi:hypothetical protein